MTATATATPARTKALIGALTLLVAAVALCADRVHNGDLYLNLLTGRFISAHGLVAHDPFPTIAHGQPWLNQQWLSELAFFRVFQGVGLTGLSVLYAALLAAPLALLLWCCRRKGAVMMAAVSALYFPGLLAVIHPRAAGFTVLAFSVLVLLILAAWRMGGGSRVPTARWPFLAIPLLFALWANLHGGFVAGLLLIGLAVLGATADRLRGLSWPFGARRVLAVGLAGAIGVGLVTFATPLGNQIWAYLASFQNPAISLGSKEWGPAIDSPLSLAYLTGAAAFAFWLWWRMPGPRRALPITVAAGLLVFASISSRNIIFVGPAIAFLVACCAPDRASSGSHRLGLPAALTGSAALIAIAVWAGFLGPPHQEDHIGSRTVAYALKHPPRSGRIVAYAGVDSYILWRSPRTPVVIDGWLEHFSEGQLRVNYGLLRGWHHDPSRIVRRFRVGAVIAHLPRAIDALERHGFVARYVGPEDTYLVRRGALD